MNRTNLNLSRTFAGLVCCLLLTPVVVHAQDDKPAPATPPKQMTPADARRQAIHNRDPGLDPMKTFYLRVGSGANDGNEILTGLRVILDPSTKLYLVPSRNAIVVRGTPEDLAMAEKVLADIDLPRKVYKLTYTITESEGGKRVGLQRFTTVQIPGGRTTLKNGSKVPVATGSYTAGSGSQTQFTYLDVGLNFDSTIDEGANGFRLRSKVEQSSAAEEKVVNDVHEPIIRQSVLEGTSIIVPGQPLMLGSLDIAGSTRHLDIEAVLELAK